MSWKGNLLKAGISSNGKDIEIFNGSLTVKNGVIMGVSGNAKVLTNATHVFSVFTEHSATTGTVRSFELTQTMLVADASVIQEALYVDIESAVMTGDWTNAIVGRINYTAPGNANGGMAAAICGEMSLMGAAQSGGAYYSLDAEIGCTEDFTCAANPALPVAFLKCGVWGNATAVGSFDSGGYLLHVDGLTAGAGKLLSLTSQTLRCDVEGSARYLTLSQMEDGLGLGVSGTAMVLTNATHAVSIFTEHSALTGTVRSVEITQTMLVADVSTIQEALYVDIESSVTTGDWTNAIVGRVNYTAPGNANGGMVAAICAEMSLMGAAQSGGAYYSLDCEMDCPASFVHAANDALPVAFLKFGLWGDAKGEFDDHGFLFHIDGVTAGNTHMFDSQIDSAAAQIDHTLKINIGGTAYYIPLMDNPDGS